MAELKACSTHWLKVWPEYYDDVANGLKPFEVRIDDRYPRYEAGDVLILAEWDNSERKYTGRDCKKKATYVLRDERFVRDGYCIIGLSDIRTPESQEPRALTEIGKAIKTLKDILNTLNEYPGTQRDIKAAIAVLGQQMEIVQEEPEEDFLPKQCRKCGYKEFEHKK